MIDDKKSTDPGLSAAERKTLRSRETEEAIAEHESAQKAFHANRSATGRTSSAGGGRWPLLYPAPELPDDIPLETSDFSTRVRNALTTGGLKTVGEIFGSVGPARLCEMESAPSGKKP